MRTSKTNADELTGVCVRPRPVYAAALNSRAVNEYLFTLRIPARGCVDP